MRVEQHCGEEKPGDLQYSPSNARRNRCVDKFDTMLYILSDPTEMGSCLIHLASVDWTGFSAM